MQNLVLHPLPYGQVSSFPLPLIGYAGLEQGLFDSPAVLEITQHLEADFDSLAFIPVDSAPADSYYLTVKLTGSAERREQGEVWGFFERIDGDELPYHAKISWMDGGYQLEGEQKEEGVLAGFFERLTHELLPRV